MKNNKSNKSKTDIFIKIENGRIFACSNDAKGSVCGYFSSLERLREQLDEMGQGHMHGVCLLLPDDFHCCELIRLPAMSQRAMQANVRARALTLHKEGEILDAYPVSESKGECCVLVSVLSCQKLDAVKAQLTRNGFLLCRIIPSALASLAFIQRHCHGLRGKTYGALLVHGEELDVVLALKGRYAASITVSPMPSDLDGTVIQSTVNKLAKASFSELCPKEPVQWVLIGSGGIQPRVRGIDKALDTQVKGSVFDIPSKYRGYVERGLAPDMIYAIESDREQINAVI